MWEYNSVELPQREMFWEYNFTELPQMICFKKIQLRKVASKEMFWGNTTPESCLEGNILRIQFCRISSKEMFWEYNSVKLPQRESVGIQLQKVAPKECRVGM